MCFDDDFGQQSEILDRLAQLVCIFNKEAVRDLRLGSRCRNRLRCVAAGLHATSWTREESRNVPLFNNVVNVPQAGIVEAELNRQRSE